MGWLEILGLIAGICTTSAVVPQIIKAFKTKKVDDISPVMFSILMAGVGLWVIYGIYKNDMPIILTNGISFLLNGVMLFLMLFYKRRHR